MTPSLSKNNMSQISMQIRNKLGARTIDEAVRIFENKYFNLN